MNNIGNSARRGIFFGLLCATTLVAGYVFAVPADFKSNTLATTAQWAKLCGKSAHACSVVKRDGGMVIYRVCGIPECFNVECVDDDKDANCGKRVISHFRAPPRKLRTVVASML